MPATIAILEDNTDRILEMRDVLAELLPGLDACFFDNALEMIDWLKENLADTVLISLDHDLPVVQYRNGRAVDAGTGRMVADFLASLEPTCPVVVHSSNAPLAGGMVAALKDAGWPYKQVHPWGDFEWIKQAWKQEIQAYIEKGWISR